MAHNVAFIVLKRKTNDFFYLRADNDTDKSHFWSLPLKSFDWQFMAKQIDERLGSNMVDLRGILHIQMTHDPATDTTRNAIYVLGTIVNYDSKRFKTGIPGRWEWKDIDDVKEMHDRGDILPADWCALQAAQNEDRLIPFESISTPSIDSCYAQKPTTSDVAQQQCRVPNDVARPRRMPQLLRFVKYSDALLGVLHQIFSTACFPSQRLSIDQWIELVVNQLCIVQTESFAREAFIAVLQDHDSDSPQLPSSSHTLATFWDFVTLIATLDRKTVHGDVAGVLRTRYICRVYGSRHEQQEDGLHKDAIMEMIKDAGEAKKIPSDDMPAMIEEQMRNLEGHFDATTGRMSVDAFVDLVDTRQFRGTSYLFRGFRTIVEAITGIKPKRKRQRPLSSLWQPFENIPSRPTSSCSVPSADSSEIDTGGRSSKRPRHESVPAPSTSRTTDSPAVSSTTNGDGATAQEPFAWPTTDNAPSSSTAPARSMIKFFDVDITCRSLRSWIRPMDERRIFNRSTVTESAREVLEDLRRTHAAEQTRVTDAVVASDILKGLDYFSRPIEARYRRTDVGDKMEFEWGPEIPKSKMAQCVLELCARVARVLDGERRLLVDIPAPCYIMGDIHGNFIDLKEFHDNFWPLNPQFCPANLLFLGDYVDRGPFQLEVIMYLFAHKVLAPEKVTLLRGNHETRYINKQSREDRRGFVNHLRFRFRDQPLYADRIFDAVHEVFDRLPVAAVVDGKVLCVHGGIPEPGLYKAHGVNLLHALRNFPVFPIRSSGESNVSNIPADMKFIYQILWNDPELVKNKPQPNECDAEGFSPNFQRQAAAQAGGVVKMFSEAALNKCLQENGLSFLVRAHEHLATINGFHLRYNARLFTVFSSSRYTYHDNSAACLLVEPGRAPMAAPVKRAKVEMVNNVRIKQEPVEEGTDRKTPQSVVPQSIINVFRLHDDEVLTGRVNTR